MGNHDSIVREIFRNRPLVWVVLGNYERGCFETGSNRPNPQQRPGIALTFREGRANTTNVRQLYMFTKIKSPYLSRHNNSGGVRHLDRFATCRLIGNFLTLAVEMNLQSMFRETVSFVKGNGIRSLRVRFGLLGKECFGCCGNA